MVRLILFLALGLCCLNYCVYVYTSYMCIYMCICVYIYICMYVYVYIYMCTFKIGAQFFNTVLAVYHCISLVRYIDYCHSVFCLVAGVDKSLFRVFTQIVFFSFALFLRVIFFFPFISFFLPFCFVVVVADLILCLYF